MDSSITILIISLVLSNIYLAHKLDQLRTAKPEVGSYWHRAKDGYSHQAEIKAIYTLFDGEHETECYLLKFHGGKNGDNIIMSKEDFMDKGYIQIKG